MSNTSIPFTDLYGLLVMWAQEPATQALFVALILDVILGSLAALRHKEFDRQFSADWYWTNVLPYAGGYFLLYVLAKLGAGPVIQDLVASWIGPDIGGTAGDGLALAALAPATLALSKSLPRNWNRLIGPVETVAEPAQPAD